VLREWMAFALSFGGTNCALVSVLVYIKQSRVGMILQRAVCHIPMNVKLLNASRFHVDRIWCIGFVHVVLEGR
jgi:hypothetical protein